MKTKTKKELLLYLLFLLFLILFLVSGILFGFSFFHQQQEDREFSELAELIVSEPAESQISSVLEESQETESAPEFKPEDQPLDPAERYAALFERNPDFIGWLYIEGTGVNYPVMSTPHDPEYYIHRNFSKKYSYSGIPFFGKDCTLLSDNIIIYGHNMKNGTMFSDLLNYAKREYWEAHPMVTFHTLAAYGNYEIVGAFYEKVHTVDEGNVFRYYNYGGELTEEEFDSYIRQVKRASCFDSGITPEYGDQLLTLSTCAYHTDNGRFVVVARKAQPQAPTTESDEDEP